MKNPFIIKPFIPGNSREVTLSLLYEFWCGMLTSTWKKTVNDFGSCHRLDHPPIWCKSRENSVLSGPWYPTFYPPPLYRIPKPTLHLWHERTRVACRCNHSLKHGWWLWASLRQEGHERCVYDSLPPGNTGQCNGLACTAMHFPASPYITVHCSALPWGIHKQLQFKCLTIHQNSNASTKSSCHNAFLHCFSTQKSHYFIKQMRKISSCPLNPSKTPSNPYKSTNFSGHPHSKPLQLQFKITFMHISSLISLKLSKIWDHSEILSSQNGCYWWMTKLRWNLFSGWLLNLTNSIRGLSHKSSQSHPNLKRFAKSNFLSEPNILPMGEQQIANQAKATKCKDLLAKALDEHTWSKCAPLSSWLQMFLVNIFIEETRLDHCMDPKK